MTISSLNLPRSSDRRDAQPTSANVLHLCNGLDPERDGGMVPSILGMTGAFASLGSHVQIVTPTPSRLDTFRVPQGVSLRGPEASLEEAVAQSDVVHMHGLWQQHTRRGARACQVARVPYLVAAHGMADPWALRQKRWKKAVYSTLIEGPTLRGASCLHALTRPEIQHLRAFAPKASVALIPNGVDLDPFQALPDRASYEVQHPELRGKFVLLFFGRVHKKKGLDLLAPAIAGLTADHPDVHLLVAGLDDGALLPFLKHAEELAIHDRITYVGHVSGEESRRVWGAADAFVLPSHSEGFSMSVLEALASRLPVLVTHACHFAELDAHDAGLCVDATVAGVTTGLRGLLERSDDQREAMALRGRRLVEERYTWAQQARRLDEVYAWLTGGGERPEAVRDADERDAR